jgi:hypothetical protein
MPPHQSKKMKRSLARERDSKRQSERLDEAKKQDLMKRISQEAVDERTRRLKVLDDERDEWQKKLSHLSDDERTRRLNSLVDERDEWQKNIHDERKINDFDFLPVKKHKLSLAAQSFIPDRMKLSIAAQSFIPNSINNPKSKRIGGRNKKNRKSIRKTRKRNNRK